MKTRIQIISVSVVALFLILPFNSCKFLDVDDFFNESLRYDSIFISKRNTERYLWAIAANLPDEGNIFYGGVYTPGVTATDEAFSISTAYTGYNLLRGTYSASSNPYNSFYENMYQIIRKANIVIQRVNEVRDMEEKEKNETCSYAYFLKAYASYHLLNLYGPIVIQGDEPLETNASPDYYDKSRSTYDECIEYICGEFEKAARYLPIEAQVQNYGRPTQGAAWALIARLRLQHASPLYNGTPPGHRFGSARTIYSDFIRSADGKNYIQQDYDESRWATAALSAKRIIESNRYELHIVNTFDTPERLPYPTNNNYPASGARPIPTDILNAEYPNGIADVNAYRSYLDMFNGEVLPIKNPEIIWGRNTGAVSAHVNRCLPYQFFRGNNNFSISQKMVDAFYMDDGRTIEDARENGYYSETGDMGDVGNTTISANQKFFRQNDSQSAYYILNRAHGGGDNIRVRNMYNNREMRFYASISFDGVYFEGISATKDAEKNKKISYQYSANGGKIFAGNSLENYPITGYSLRKYLHREDSNASGGSIVSKHFPIIRFAEILLSYAEALNNLESPQTVMWMGEPVTVVRDIEEIASAFNRVRFRAGLPGLTAEELASPEKIQELIERERLIEFLCENRRYFDLRRWGKYQDSEQEPMLGMSTDYDGDLYYTRALINHPRAREREGSDNNKYILLPLPLSEMRKMSKLDQNPGWER